ncbi:phage tail assembly chaperone [Lentilactobacillus farraginis]|nr:phage tail assembly chaperone [Lentilactobacillus farraginis]GAF37824.1 phage tail assembly [Lentilactobacillus farraginis DSM 18382 = JCM 14108]
MKINITKLGLRKKSAEVKTTVGVVEKAQNLQIQLLKSDAVDFTNDDPLAVLEAQKKMVQGLLQFMIDIFKLTDQEVEKIKSTLDFTDFQNFMAYVLFRFQGMSDEDWETVTKQQSEESADPKEKQLRLAKLINDLSISQQDMLFFKQQMMKQGILPDELNRQDYFEFMAVLNAKDKKKQVTDPVVELLNKRKGTD